MHGFDDPRVSKKADDILIIYVKPRKQGCDGIAALYAFLTPERHVRIGRRVNFREIRG